MVGSRNNSSFGENFQRQTNRRSRVAARSFLPTYTALFNLTPIESLKICNSNAMHRGKKFFAAIFSAIVYSITGLLTFVLGVSCQF